MAKRQPKPTGNSVANTLALFGNEPVAPKVFKTKKSKAAPRKEINLGSDFDTLAAFKVFEKLLEQEGKRLRDEKKQDVIEIFTKAAIKYGKKPESFVGTGEVSSASCEIRKRGKNMPLDPEVAELLKDMGIPINETIKVEERIILNPELDQKSLVRLSELIKKDKLLSKEQIMLPQGKEFTYTVADSTIDMLAKKDLETFQTYIEQVAVFAIGKFKLEGEGIESGVKEEKAVTPEAKAMAIAILQDVGVLPAPVPTPKKKRKELSA